MDQLAIVMPVYNESEGISEFINEISSEFSGISLSLHVVNDCSTDETLSVLNEIGKNIPYLNVLTNKVNSGHGPTTLRALREGLSSNAQVIMAVDGDGQFIAQEMREFYEAFLISSRLYGEGLREYRQDPWYRKSISFITRMIVTLKSGKYSKDANTPCRIYKKEFLESALQRISSSSLTPNIQMSIFARRSDLEIHTFRLTNIARRGSVEVGTSWGKNTKFLPSKRLVIFCKNAFLEQMRKPRY